jgi:hypothetical protein
LPAGAAGQLSAGRRSQGSCSSRGRWNAVRRVRTGGSVAGFRALRSAGRWSGSPHVGSLTFWDGRQPIVGSVGAMWPPAPSATSATAPAEEPQHHQQQREQYDDHNHVVFPSEAVGP